MSESSKSRKFINRLFPIIVVTGTLIAGLALASYAVLGYFSRYYADDYCMSGLVFQKGFWQAQIDQYVGWSNRYSGMFILSLSELLGRPGIRFWTGFVILLLVLTFVWLLFQINKRLGLSFSRWLVVLFSELTVFVTLLLAPQLYQSFFWRIGLITYTLPLAFLVFLAGLVIHYSAQTPTRQIPYRGLVAGLLLAFVAGGFSETYLVLQISLSTLSLMFVLIFLKGTNRRNSIIMLVAVMAGSALSLLVVLMSPGNAVRQAAMPHPPGLLSWIKMIGLHTFLFMYRTLAANPFLVLLAILLPFFLIYGFYSNKDMPRVKPSLLIFTLLVIPLIGFVLVAAIMTPAAYAQSSYPDGRVLVEAGFVVASMLIGMGALLGVIFYQIHRWAEEIIPVHLVIITIIFVFVLILYPLYDMRKNLLLLPEYTARAEMWDVRDARIRSARQDGVFDIHEVAINAPADLSELRPNPADWVNTCATWFYDVSSITAGNP